MMAYQMTCWSLEEMTLAKRRRDNKPPPKGENKESTAATDGKFV